VDETYITHGIPGEGSWVYKYTYVAWFPSNLDAIILFTLEISIDKIEAI
jgi:hypothetical protein